MNEPLSYACPTCGREVKVGRPCAGCPLPVPRRKVPASKQGGGRKPQRKARPWASVAGSDGLDLPDRDFDYEAYVAREFGRLPHARAGLRWYWWALGVVLVSLMLLGLIGLVGFWF